MWNVINLLTSRSKPLDNLFFKGFKIGKKKLRVDKRGQRSLNFPTFCLAFIRSLYHARQDWWCNRSQLINGKKWAAETWPYGSGSQLPVSPSGSCWKKKRPVPVFSLNSYDYMPFFFFFKVWIACKLKKKKKRFVYWSCHWSLLATQGKLIF